MTDFEIHTGIDLHDIQGNVIKGYGRYGFPFARYVMYQIHAYSAGREFMAKLLPLITNSAPWTRPGAVQARTERPDVTTNLALTYSGLEQLGVPDRSLLSFPDEFVMGMRARTLILGDDGPSDPQNWDPIWQSADRPQVVDLLVTINAKTEDLRTQRYDEIVEMAAQCGNEIHQLIGHRNSEGDTAPYQDAGALRGADGHLSEVEHFGYVDGISDPYFKESGSHPDYVTGGGKRVRDKPATDKSGWEPIATGEFVLGHVDEADEYPVAPIPSYLAANGTFLVYRKLHQNVAAFERFLDEKSTAFSGDRELFAAKLVGRWRNGAPLATFPTKEAADGYDRRLQSANHDRNDPRKDDAAREAASTLYYELRQQRMAFDFRHDIDGARCPVGAHIRRANPRGALEFGKDGAFNTPGALVDRRRLVRRGLPYGDSSEGTDDGDHGIIFMALGVSISRQFEFVQQQWINYGNDFKLGNDRDPIIGNQPAEGGRMIFEADPDGTDPPHFCTGIPRFVETRGGDYFFVPSLRALAGIARGKIDPT